MRARQRKRRSTGVQPGIYAHYKGGLYRVLYSAQHTETEEEVVVYQSLYDEQIWVRPASMFCGEVEALGERFPRFSLLSVPNLFFLDEYDHRRLEDNSENVRIA